ncbi:Shedu immune nuclease family protein [Pedobacter frigiditerrae]|uniref:Shedu immune nuclease family protein n=1 Tax=Pedobacter frigiditerrae TaxID=2530452 RepID=UPI00293151D2|nr:Shedu immune nuclease family protein [Pedobacter frigiditerrae]
MLEDEIPDKSFGSQRALDKTYFSKSFTTPYQDFKKKFAYKILDHEGNEYLMKDEKTLGFSLNGKRQLKALFLQDDRNIVKLIVQQFGLDNKPIKNQSKEATFHSNEVQNLYNFLKGIKEVDFPNDLTFNIKDSELAKMLMSKNQASKLIEENLEVLQEALNSNLSTKDLINFGYRKNQLEIFDKLLNEEGFFKEYKDKLQNQLNKEQGDEGVWQKFFEKNTWILGYGLDYIFNSELDNKKLEQVTSGSSFFSKGKRIDALLKSHGVINSLCFCELKLSTDTLLTKIKKSYREESWQISDALSGAIAQVQRTVQKAIKDCDTKTELKDAQDNLTGETVYLYNPKAFIIIGNLNEFIIDEKINEVKFSSFDMFRKNLRNIEILTYDELFQRAYYICHKQ